MQQTPFLQVDYRLLQLNEIEHNGEKHKLTLQSKIVYSYLKSLSKSFSTVRPSLESIATNLGLGSEQVARREIKTLTKAGLLTVVSRPGTSNAFIVNPVMFSDEEQTETPEIQGADAAPETPENTVRTPHKRVFTPLSMTCSQQDVIAAEMERLSRPLPKEKPIERYPRNFDSDKDPF